MPAPAAAPPPPPVATPTSTAPKKEEGGAITALAAWYTAFFIIGPNARAAFSLFWHHVIEWYEDASYTLDRWGARKIVPWLFGICALTFLGRYYTAAVDPDFLEATQRPFWGSKIIICSLAVYFLCAVRPVTSLQRDAAYKPYGDACKRVEAVTAQMSARPPMATEADLDAAETVMRAEWTRYRDWERRAGRPVISLLQALLITYICLVVEGFAYFFNGEDVYHMVERYSQDQGVFVAMTQEEIEVNQQHATNEFWYGAICYAGPLWFLMLYGVPKWFLGPIMRIASKAERAFIRGLQAGEAALINGVDMRGIEARDLALQKEYGNTYRTAVDVLRNEIEHPFFGVMLGSAIQLLVAWRTMYLAVTVQTAIGSLVLLIIETAIVNRFTDQVPVVHTHPRWVRIVSALPIIPPIYGLIVGGDANGVVPPKHYWLLLTGAASTVGDVAVSAGGSAAGPTVEYVHHVGGLTIQGMMAFTAIIIGVFFILRLVWLPFMEFWGKIKPPILRWPAALLTIFLGGSLAYGWCAQVFVAPANLPHRDPVATVATANAPSTACDSDGDGRILCTHACYEAAGLSTTDENIETGRREGFCQPVIR